MSVKYLPVLFRTWFQDLLLNFNSIHSSFYRIIGTYIHFYYIRYTIYLILLYYEESVQIKPYLDFTIDLL